MTFRQKQITASLITLLFSVGLVLAAYDFVSESSVIKKTGKTIENRLSIFAQIELPLYFMPRFPDRLTFLASELAIASEELERFSQEVNQLAEKCDCKNIQSFCRQEVAFGAAGRCSGSGVFGDPCSSRKKIQQKQSEVKDKLDQLSRLRNLLENEMKISLERELQTLRSGTAEELKSNLEKLIQLSRDFESPGQNLGKLPSQYSLSQCSAQCSQDISFTIKACLNPGQQKPMTVKFEVGVEMGDLKLGKVGIKNINLNLPKEIQLPDLGDLSSFSIPLPSATINFPEVKVGEIIDLSDRPIVFHAPSVPVPKLPVLELSCPQPPSLSSSYQWGGSPRPNPLVWLGFEWYSQNFRWMSEQCQGLPGMRDHIGAPTEKFKECFNSATVVSAILSECDSQWANSCAIDQKGVPPSGICRNLRHSCKINADVASADQCQKLFSQEGEPSPSSCTYTISIDDMGLEFLSLPPDFAPVATLEQKCRQLKEQGRKEEPEPCKFLPLFKKEFPLPEQFEHSEPAQTAPAQTIGDFPRSILGCPVSPSTIPKIILPDIVIPDIKLGGLNFCPFFAVQLPGFIFEDLILPDIELCNLDNCFGFFPDLKFRLPSLDIPEISASVPLPETCVFVEGAGNTCFILPDIELRGVQFPVINFALFQLFNLSNLITPELELPSISLPQPKVFLRFAGIDIDFLNLLLGLISQAFSIPSGCIDINFRLGCLQFGIEDWVFSWPGFVQIPQIPFCQDINRFCRDMKTALGEVFNKVSEIEKVVNDVFQKEVQEKLNRAASQINQILKQAIEGQLQELANVIKVEIEKHIRQFARVENGVIKIPPFSTPAKSIPIPSISVKELANLPDRISIPWPESLKKIILTRTLTYPLPDIPLSRLSWKKEIEIKIPGFQLPSVTLDINFLGNRPACKSEAPAGGNPLPTGAIENAFSQVKQIGDELEKTSQNIINVLR